MESHYPPLIIGTLWLIIAKLETLNGSSNTFSMAIACLFILTAIVEMFRPHRFLRRIRKRTKRY